MLGYSETERDVSKMIIESLRRRIVSSVGFYPAILAPTPATVFPTTPMELNGAAVHAVYAEE